jgi:hypothetical protein
MPQQSNITTELPQNAVSTKRPNIVIISLSILLVVSTIGYLIYQNWQMRIQPKTYDTCIDDPKSSKTITYPGTCVTQFGIRFEQTVKVTTPTPEPQIVRAYSLPIGTISGMRLLKNQRFSIEIPESWYIAGDTNISNHSQLNITILDSLYKQVYGDPYQNSINIQLSDMYDTYNKNKWSDVVTKDSFFDLQGNLWLTIMRKSGGGGLLKTNIEETQLAGQKMVKRMNTWTKVMEGFEAIDTNYFMPDVSSQSSFLVWNISYRLPIQGQNISERNQLISKILSTIKIIDQTDTSN